jgi:hypothetical protein
MVPFKPFGESLPQMVIPLQEETYVILSPDLVVNRPGEYGLGYALLRVPDHGGGFLGYGPGKFLNGFQSIVFSVGEHGESKVRMAFTANRPTKILNIPYDPVGLGFRAANILTLGQASRVAGWFTDFLPSFMTPTGIDPMQAYIAFMNAITAGAAAEHFGLSKYEADRFMLVQHFMQHYEMITGALATYRHVPDWSAGMGIPLWIRTGSIPRA